jgi:hypothetical protein
MVSILFSRFFNFNCSFCFCFVSVNLWEKVNLSFMCWAIVQTKTHATNERDHLWNDKLQIKSTPMPTLVRVLFFKLFTLSSI